MTLSTSLFNPNNLEISSMIVSLSNSCGRFSIWMTIHSCVKISATWFFTAFTELKLKSISEILFKNFTCFWLRLCSFISIVTRDYLLSATHFALQNLFRGHRKRTLRVPVGHSCWGKTCHTPRPDLYQHEPAAVLRQGAQIHRQQCGNQGT